MRKIKAIILRNEQPDDHLIWVESCREYSESIEYVVVDLTANNWVEEIERQRPDVLLARPCGLTSLFKQLYDEKIFILHHKYGDKIFPSPLELYLYENKRLLSFWLRANSIPHPDTNVFYNEHEAEQFVNGTNFPIVGKVSIGGAGSGVKVLYNKADGLKYIRQSFRGSGAPRRSGPNLAKGGILKRGFHYILNPSDIKSKLKIYNTVRRHPQKEFVIFQEFIPHQFEWRAVRIGDSFFAHKKLKIGDKASGSLLKEYGKPPADLMDFIRVFTEKHKFYSEAIDIFESDRGFLVNELQCFFGQSDPHQMIIEGNPGRYIYSDNEWKFEEGNFNRNQSYNLRLEWVIKLFNEGKNID